MVVPIPVVCAIDGVAGGVNLQEKANEVSEVSEHSIVLVSSCSGDARHMGSYVLFRCSKYIFCTWPLFIAIVNIPALARSIRFS